MRSRARFSSFIGFLVETLRWVLFSVWVKFFGRVLSCVFRLRSHGYLLCSGSDGVMFEINVLPSVWKYLRIFGAYLSLSFVDVFFVIASAEFSFYQGICLSDILIRILCFLFSVLFFPAYVRSLCTGCTLLQLREYFDISLPDYLLNLYVR